MKVTLEEITEDTLTEVLQLEVAPEQTNLVESVAVSISRAHFSRCAWFRAVFADGKPVGFAMLHLDGAKPEYILKQLLIDRRYQKRGYGSAAVGLLIDFVRSLPESRGLQIRYAKGSDFPIGFFAKFGFVDTGTTIDGERVLMLELE
jgi:diamine N-acetyltransferase